jgi:hypothetical protein
MYLPDNIQNHLRAQGLITINEVIKKEGDLYVAVNVVDQQRRIVNVDHQLIESLTKQSSVTPRKNSGGLLKG